MDVYCKDLSIFLIIITAIITIIKINWGKDTYGSKECIMKKLKFLFTIVFVIRGICSIFAQDTIVLKSGAEIQAKVLEINSVEIKYKRFDNPEGPTIVIGKAEVLSIKYENGAQEIINTDSSQAPDAAAINAPHNKDFYTGIFFNPLGFLQFGPILGADFTINRHFIIDTFLLIPSIGMLTRILYNDNAASTSYKGIGIGAGAQYFTGGNTGGFYVGPIFMYWVLDYTDSRSNSYESKQLAIACNAGYKFQFPSGFHVKTGGFVGANIFLDAKWNGGYSSSDGDVVFFGMFEVALGFAF